MKRGNERGKKGKGILCLQTRVGCFFLFLFVFSLSLNFSSGKKNDFLEFTKKFDGKSPGKRKMNSKNDTVFD